jgi:DNA-binding response OmpR family regulator
MKKTILVVAGDADMGIFLHSALSQEATYHILLAMQGFEALKVTHYITPQLFILNYHLQRMNGIELYDRLHTRYSLQATPAILLSTSLSSHQQEIAKRNVRGMSIPLELDELLATVKMLVAPPTKESASFNW